jgi:hypothetical protein
VKLAPKVSSHFQRLGGFLKTLNVREVAVGLDGIGKTRGCLLTPAVKRLFRGETVEGIVDLDGFKVPYIVTIPARQGQVWG